MNNQMNHQRNKQKKLFKEGNVEYLIQCFNGSDSKGRTNAMYSVDNIRCNILSLKPTSNKCKSTRLIVKLNLNVYWNLFMSRKSKKFCLNFSFLQPAWYDWQWNKIYLNVQQYLFLQKFCHNFSSLQPAWYDCRWNKFD